MIGPAFFRGFGLALCCVCARPGFAAVAVGAVPVPFAPAPLLSAGSSAGLVLPSAPGRWPGGGGGPGVSRPISVLRFDDVPASPGPSSGFQRSALVTSVLLPGLAHYRMGEKGRGLAFLAVEAALWTSFAVHRIQGENREDSYEEMAVLFAGIAPDAPGDEDFYKALANWPSSDLYNEIVVRRLARSEAGDDPEARERWYEENRIQGNEVWSWDSEAARTAYREKRADSQAAFKRSRDMVGLAVVNRVVAMIDAVLLSNRRQSGDYGLEMSSGGGAPGTFAARVALRRNLP